MDKRLPDDVKYAVEFLKRAEAQHDNHARFFRDLHFGIELLLDYVEDRPNSNHLNFIKNTIVAYTRLFLEKLPSLELDNPITWIAYEILFLRVRDYLDTIFEKYPYLKNNYDAFHNDSLRQEANDLIEQYEKKEKTKKK